MRCNWQRWLWGLIPLIMVSWVAVQVERERIEQDLTERAKRALTASGSPWASVDTQWPRCRADGQGASRTTSRPAPRRRCANVWGVREVENRAILPPKIEPFIWSARRRGNRIRLSGIRARPRDAASRARIDQGGHARARGCRSHEHRAWRSFAGHLACRTELRAQAAVAAAAGRCPLRRSGAYDIGRGRRYGGLQGREYGAQERSAEGHQAIVRADHGAGGQSLHVVGPVRGWTARPGAGM